MSKATKQKRQVFQLSAAAGQVNLSRTVLSDWLSDQNYLGVAATKSLPAVGKMAVVNVYPMHHGKKQPAKRIVLENRKGALYEVEAPKAKRLGWPSKFRDIAMSHGWDIFREDDGNYRIHGLDDPMGVAEDFGLKNLKRFEGPSRDINAMKYVKDEAAKGNVVCQHALAFLAAQKKYDLSLWAAVGDSEGEEFGEDESAMVDYLYECRVEFGGWRSPPTAFESTLGTTVYVYWGDEEGNVAKPLNKAERKNLEERMVRVVVQNDPSRLFIAAPTTGQSADGDKLHKVCLIDNQHANDTADDAYMNDGYHEIATFTSLAAAKRRCAKLGCEKPEIV